MRDRLRRTLVAAALVAVSLALAACGGADFAGWGAPQPIRDARAGHMSMAFAGDGHALAVWTEEARGEHRLMFAERPPGAGWSAPEPILEGRRWSIIAPELAVNARGDAALTFSLSARQSRVVMGSHRAAGGRWEEPQALGPVGRNTGEAVVGVGARGEVVAAWHVFGEGPRVSRREAGAGWRDPSRVAIEDISFGVRVAVAPDGRAYLLAGFISPRRAVRANLYVNDGGDGWTRLPAPSVAGLRGDAVGLVVDREGHPTVVGFRAGQRPGSGALVVSRLGADRRWSSPRVLDQAHGSWFGAVEIGATAAGVEVAWTRWTEPGRRATLRAALLEEGRLVAPPAEIDVLRPRTMGAPVPETILRVSEGGRPALFWGRPEAPLMTSRFSAGAWTAPEPVTDGATAARPAAVHADNRRVVALWLELPPGLGGPARIVAAERAVGGSD